MKFRVKTKKAIKKAVFFYEDEHGERIADYSFSGKELADGAVDIPLLRGQLFCELTTAKGKEIINTFTNTTNYLINNG